jgi:nucleotide-binding universal stress UspA family protein
MGPFRKILVATDFSPHAANALKLAAELAKQSGAPLHVIHVYDMIPYTLPEGLPVFDGGQMARVREELGQQLRKLASEAQRGGVQEMDSALVEGQPSAEIVRRAQEGQYDLIVMGTHGRSGFAHLLLGSVAERVMRKAPCAVLVVPLVEARGAGREQEG